MKSKGFMKLGGGSSRNTEFFDAIFDPSRSFKNLIPLMDKWAGDTFQWHGNNLFLDEDINEVEQKTVFKVTFDDAYDRMEWFLGELRKRKFPTGWACHLHDDFFGFYFENYRLC